MTQQQSESDRGYAEAIKRISIARKAFSKSLGLGNLGLGTLPPEIGQLTTLTSLHLSGNRLSVLPAEIGRLAPHIIRDTERAKRRAIRQQVEIRLIY